MRNVFVKTLGCKVNSFDSSAIENQFKSRGYTLVESSKDADITVINTCSVTAAAEKEARYLLRKFSREAPNAMRVVTGCYAQIDSSHLLAMSEVDFVVPNEAKEDLVGLIETKINASPEDKLKFPVDLNPVESNKQSQFKSELTLFDDAMSEDRTRTFLKIQDGCNGFCAYCQIPYARGASRSVEHDRVLAQVKKLVKQGVPEIVFTGIHLGDYGREGLDDLEDLHAQTPFVTLLQEVFLIPGLKRLRISSLEPAEVSWSLVNLLGEHRDKFCDHFHLPLQSGSDRILKMMGRKYDSARYYRSIEMIRSVFPDAQITADVIPGFPGETDQDFAEGTQFIKRAELAGLHVFPYSKRPNTRALRMPDHLDPQTIKARAASLRKLGAQLQSDYARKFLGTSQMVLWETTQDAEGRRMGKTKNYLNVWARSEMAQAGAMSSVVLKGFLRDGHLLGIEDVKPSTVLS